MFLEQDKAFFFRFIWVGVGMHGYQYQCCILNNTFVGFVIKKNPQCVMALLCIQY